MCSGDVAEKPRPRPLDALEGEICELASHIHAATCRWLGLVAEFDRREGWAPWGCRSCAHWVSWRCAIAPVAAREHVRVARRLADLPLIRAAFARGQLSYSKVRALTRVGTVEREAELLELARHATAAQLERLVRGYRGVVAVERAARGEPPPRWLRWSYDDDGSLLIRGRLPAEEGAVVIAALDAARDQLAAHSDGDSDASPEAHDRDASAEAHDGGGASAEALVQNPEGASAETLHRDPEGASAEAPHRDPGEARADALVLMADTLLAHGPARRCGGERYQVVVHVDAAALRDDGGERCELDAGVPLAAETARRIACDASLVPLLASQGRTLGVGRKRRTVPTALRRALAARDRGCRFPGCHQRRHADAHHVHHWAHGGATKLGNLIELCPRHHRLLHEGGYTLDGKPSGQLIFRRPDGRRIHPAPRPPNGHADAIRRTPIDPEACTSLSNGERLDLALGVDALLAFAPIEAPGI